MLGGRGDFGRSSIFFLDICSYLFGRWRGLGVHLRPSGDAEIGSENRIGPLKLDETTLVSQINKYNRKSEKLEILEGGGGIKITSLPRV